VLSYKEISEVLNDLDKEYAELRSSNQPQKQQVGGSALFIIRRVRKELRKKIIDKYSK
jgi:ribosomal protein L29